MDPTLSRKHIRQSIRAKRNLLSKPEQQQSGLHLLQQVQSSPQIMQAKNVAIYLSYDGEIDTKPIIEWLWQKNKTVLLPVLHPFSKGQLLFLCHTPELPLTFNKYGIAEPILNKNHICPLSDIDIIFTPLVAFDSTGQRLGMGGGYYDRTLERFYKTGEGAIPIGLAHHCQQVDVLPYQDWDIPLPIIMTPNKIWHWDN